MYNLRRLYAVYACFLRKIFVNRLVDQTICLLLASPPSSRQLLDRQHDLRGLTKFFERLSNRFKAKRLVALNNQSYAESVGARHSIPKGKLPF